MTIHDQVLPPRKRYGYSSRFSKTDKVWLTDKAVAELISKDIELFNRYEIEVKLNFSLKSIVENSPSPE